MWDEKELILITQNKMSVQIFFMISNLVGFRVAHPDGCFGVNIYRKVSNFQMGERRIFPREK